MKRIVMSPRRACSSAGSPLRTPPSRGAPPAAAAAPQVNVVEAVVARSILDAAAGHRRVFPADVAQLNLLDQA